MDITGTLLSKSEFWDFDLFAFSTLCVIADSMGSSTEQLLLETANDGSESKLKIK